MHLDRRSLLQDLRRRRRPWRDGRARAFRLRRHAERPPPGGGDPARRAGRLGRRAAAWRQGLCRRCGAIWRFRPAAPARCTIWTVSSGLHPSFTNLKTLYDAKQLVVFHNICSPYRDRSHFDGQNVLESGGIQPHLLQDGWLNRALAAHGHRQWRPRAGDRPDPALDAVGQSANRRAGCRR